MSGKTAVVAGAGVVGLAVARAAARRGLQVLLLERNALVGQEASARNSEVVHAGIYYNKGSWKARLCVEGREQLYAFCDDYGVAYNKCGKLIVAQEHQAEQLRAIGARGRDNGVDDLRLISREEARAIESEVECHEAIFSPSTGIVDSHGLMLALQGDAEAHGAMVARNTSVRSVKYDAASESFTVQAETAESGEVDEVECDYFVNASGIFAPLLVGDDLKLTTLGRPEVPSKLAKGTYFKLSGRKPFSHLVYPIPEVGGLGVHSTVDLEGNVKFGPDVEWVDNIDYVPNPAKAEAFAERIRSYWPEVQADMLVADYCGIRPKVNVGGKTFEDFWIADEKAHGVPGLVHLCGIESPGLTSSLAIADAVTGMLKLH